MAIYSEITEEVCVEDRKGNHHLIAKIWVVQQCAAISATGELLSSFLSTVSWMECDSAVLTSCYVIAVKRQEEAMLKQQVKN